MFTLLDVSASREDDDLVVVLNLGGIVSAEDVAELIKRIDQEFVLTPK